MVTKEGYQKGAKEYAQHYGISLKELRSPKSGEGIIAEIEFCTHMSVRYCLFLIDEDWAKDNGYDLTNYKKRLDIMSDFGRSTQWSNATHIPLQTTDDLIRDSKGQVISSLNNLQNNLSQEFKHGCCHIFKFQDAFLNTIWGEVIISEVKFEEEEDCQTKIFALDASEFIKAILKDAITGEIRHIAKDLF